jgi:hypothetical protein
VGGKRDDIQFELDQMSASSDVENDLRRLRGEIAASTPKQLEGSAGGANGDGQTAHGGRAEPTQTQYAPPPPAAQPAGLPASDLPSANESPQDGEGL